MVSIWHTSEHFGDAHKMIDSQLKKGSRNGITFELFVVVKWSIFGAFGKIKAPDFWSLMRKLLI